MRQRLGRMLAGSALAAATLLGVHTLTAAPASASVPAAATAAGASGSVSVLSNSCGYPTSARPGSTFVRSYSNCKSCRTAELALEYQYSWRNYYCTYNPGNDLNDLHYQGI
ncbi:hypothetical protein [Streptosporangium pseudovulgare]|uniref:Uncharacterized protein n=1 Tax=Streptosporangium pseudovulgare TaxID=35765 RepID=A0ABQ2RK53_9ACTN|nr:hypothetical protein [Streptosporangium pseudovulgare]GGQ35215.1 hypothetical protein GCM10010140_76540 [Streptosporangium pseudovulgare]